MSDDFAMTPHQRRALFRSSPKLKGYAAEPGTGPAGETCFSCKHHVIRHFSKTYHKCALMQAIWTGGGTTDIRVRSPACAKWEGRGG